MTCFCNKYFQYFRVFITIKYCLLFYVFILLMALSRIRMAPCVSDQFAAAFALILRHRNEGEVCIHTLGFATTTTMESPTGVKLRAHLHVSIGR